MNAQRERSRSVWMDVEVAPTAEPLRSNHTADAAIVGSGIAGLSIAYELAARGLSVVVLDRGEIAGGMTSRTTAHLAPICDDSLSELLSMRGQGLAKGLSSEPERRRRSDRGPPRRTRDRLRVQAACRNSLPRS